MSTAADPAPADEASTRDRIVDVAERLFAEHGYNGVSLRTITATAGANMAAVHYYFRTKEGLLRAIFEARAGRMSAERRALLQACAAAAGAGRPPVRAVLEAFIGPGMRIGQTEQGATFNRLSAICSVEPDPTVKNIVFGVHDEVARLFVDLLARACPRLSRDELYLRLQCVFGCMMYIRADNGRVARLMPDIVPQAASAAGVEATLSRMLDFLVAGLEAPSGK
ncbi:putative HTH-type transcriptional regulator YttP [Pigmentiphaga humi]|uniref:Putative HTH-type transcriptional regulator YttP n=1 Tax=Pigmentiphaga humi TaxID=2478468 RepID=A0A3P4B1P1_9BURK|nr:TetR/AcrR family transcriptional regulator [Pigmentiphaga humi]VCU70194.1 putative HTH-type transcriptional regulator YttP [Pigmentiphaga humi]